MGRASKDKRDIYYRKAKEEGYRARSAYKLLQIHDEFNLLDPTKISTGVVDLCAAPGSWSQVLAAVLLGDGPETKRRRTDLDFSREGEMEAFMQAQKPTPISATNTSVGNSISDRTTTTIKSTTTTTNNSNTGMQLSNSIQGARYRPRIIAVDLQEMAPIKGVTILQGDITSVATARAILAHLNEPDDPNEWANENNQNENNRHENEFNNININFNVNNSNNDNNTNGNMQSPARGADLVVCDGAPDVTGMHELDEALQHYLLRAALTLATAVLRPGGSFLTKLFRGPNTSFFVARAELFFREVRVVKPTASRNASMESFLIAKDFALPAGYQPRLFTAAGEVVQLEIGPSLVFTSSNEEHANKTTHASTNIKHNTTTNNGSTGESVEESFKEASDENNTRVELLQCYLNTESVMQPPSYRYAVSAEEHASPPFSSVAAALLKQTTPLEEAEKTTRVLLPFLACGDLSGYDADMCYDLDPDREVCLPVQPPLQAPYLSQDRVDALQR